MIGLLFRRVHAQVLASTSGQQRPHEYHSLLGEHYLSVPPTADSVTIVATPASVTDQNGHYGFQEDYGAAVRWYRRAIEQGNAAAMNRFGWMHQHGQGAGAQNNIGAMFYRGQGGRQDYGEALRWYRRAADQGDATAQGNIGYMDETGRGVRRDRLEVARWYRMAAD